MSTFNDFYNIYKSGAINNNNAYDEFYNRKNNTRKEKEAIITIQKFKPIKDERCVILIPVYKAYPDDFESINLKNTFSKLAKFDVCLLCPDSLNVSAYRELAGYDLQVFRKADVFFRGKESYSRMMESPRIYRSLNAWEYTLIVQPDVYIFGTAKRLIDFIEMKPVYLGGPWTEEYCRKLGITGEYCGNGGLSLRHNKHIGDLLEKSSHKNERLKTVEDQFISYMLYHEGLAISA